MKGSILIVTVERAVAKSRMQWRILELEKIAGTKINLIIVS
jgi:hypothetical protein